ncbi:MAG: methyltransferase domain-containing protein [Gemmatimonadaceae bacterium]
MTTALRGRPLVKELERRFVIAHSKVELPGCVVNMMHPENTDALISEEDMVRDDRLPYWADIWPSSRILARALATESGAGRTLLELGAGLGLATIGAMRAGYEVLASDYYDDALLFTSANAWRALKREPRTRMIDWRDLPPDLGTFDRVVAADVIYEDRYPPLVANVIARTLAPGGVATIADPGRPMVEQFFELLPALGLRHRNTELIDYDESPAKQTIRLHHIVLLTT